MAPGGSTCRAAIVIPTHCRPFTLALAMRSALEQTVADIEVHVIGDGIDEESRALVLTAAQSDRRVRFHDLPKGPRLGERYRHDVLGQVTCQLVTYLSDDDLLFPNHVEYVEAMLADADFVHPPYVFVRPTGQLEHWPADLQRTEYRQLLLRGDRGNVVNRVPLSGAAHTLDAYRRLPEGWRTSPEGTPTDLHMWRQFLEQPWCRMVSAPAVTRLSFPAPLRTTWSAEQRAEELAHWQRRLANPSEQADIHHEVSEAFRRAALESDAALWWMLGTRWWRWRMTGVDVVNRGRSWRAGRRSARS